VLKGQEGNHDRRQCLAPVASSSISAQGKKYKPAHSTRVAGCFGNQRQIFYRLSDRKVFSHFDDAAHRQSGSNSMIFSGSGGRQLVALEGLTTL